MKLTRIHMLSVCFLLPVSVLQGQGRGEKQARTDQSVTVSIGGNVGYGFTAMKDVNRNLQGWSRFLGTKPVEELLGGLYWDGIVEVAYKRFIGGIIVSRVEANGGVSITQPQTLKEKFETAASEFLTFAGYRAPMGDHSSVSLIAAAGYGRASCDYQLYSFVNVFTPANNLDLQLDLAKPYFASRVVLRLQKEFGPVDLFVSGGYRLAKPGVLKGSGRINGQQINDSGVFGFDRKEIAFDFTGAMVSGGISFNLMGI